MLIDLTFDTPLRPGYDECAVIRWEAEVRPDEAPRPVPTDILRTDGRWYPVSPALSAYLLRVLPSFEAELSDRLLGFEADIVAELREWRGWERD